MSTKRKAKLSFAALPSDYVGLCRVFTPRPIRDAADYANTVEMTDTMVLYVNEFSADQEDYFDVLCTLIEAYDAQHVKWANVKPRKILQHLMEEHGLSGADLSRILGATSRHLGPMILRGEREITAAHARALGAHFGLPAGTFVA
jgi:HTH-type transcriptional regulator/antitoxin HigA